MNPYSQPSAPSAPRKTLIPFDAQRWQLFFRVLVAIVAVTFVLAVGGFFVARVWVRRALTDSLPQVDGTIAVSGVASAVSVARDSHGVPHIRAASLDDLVFAQGFVTAQDRLWQMDALRRHAAGELAAILGSSMVDHDRAQRILQLRAAADRALAVLPPDQLHLLQRYADGVNASMDRQRTHLPLEFRLPRYQPAAWTPRDSILVGLVMFQDLTNTFPQELNREALTARLPLPLVADLYPVSSWRDHPPSQPVVDLTAPQTDIPDIPLDESQTKLRRPSLPMASPEDLLAAERTLAPVLSCGDCRAGSNDWVVSGAHTATGKPLLSNDMHLAHRVPGIWYEADLEAAGLHVAGVTLPGVPFVIVGHNDHVAWGFTNLGARVQDMYLEHMRGAGATAEYEAPDGSWRPVLHQKEIISVKGGRDVTLDIQATEHGGVATPIVSAMFPSERRSLALRWTIYDPRTITPLFLAVDSAADGAGVVAAFSSFGGPAQNLVYADDQGHIGYHAVGKVPVRGSLSSPSPISPVPVDALDTTQEWVGTIPYDQLPQAVDPVNGMLATANNRVTGEEYAYPITLDWSAPYRNERIWKLLADRALASHDRLTPADMLAIQTDVYSDLDHVIAQRLAYAIDHARMPDLVHDKRLHEAADLLRDWNGEVEADAAAPAIVFAARSALWSLLINSKAEAQAGSAPDDHAGDLSLLYRWGNKPYAEEWLIMHTPARWLSPKYANWDDLLAAAVVVGLREAHSPYNLAKWRYGKAHPVEIEHPIYSESPLLQRLIGRPVGTGMQPQSGDDTTVKQVGRSFGPSERFTANLGALDDSTLNLVLGESSNPASAWFMDQWTAWYHGTTFPLPFSHAAVDAATVHTLTLTPR